MFKKLNNIKEKANAKINEINLTKLLALIN